MTVIFSLSDDEPDDDLSDLEQQQLQRALDLSLDPEEQQNMGNASPVPQTCVICLALVEDEEPVLSGCKDQGGKDSCFTQFYHKACLQWWREEESNTCPTCRQPLPVPAGSGQEWRPKFQMEGVVQEDSGDGRGLRNFPAGRCMYLGWVRREVHLPGEAEPELRLMREWKMMERDFVYLYTDASAPIMTERELEDAWWHQQIIDSSHRDLYDHHILTNNLHIWWKHDGRPKFQKEGVLQEDLGDAEGLQRLPEGRCMYLGWVRREVHLPGAVEPELRLMHEWKMMEMDFVYLLYTDASAPIIPGRRGLKDAWWHQPIIDSSHQDLYYFYILRNNVHIWWKNE